MKDDSNTRPSDRGDIIAADERARDVGAARRQGPADLLHQHRRPVSSAPAAGVAEATPALAAAEARSLDKGGMVKKKSDPHG